jgi:MFS family permease
MTLTNRLIYNVKSNYHWYILTLAMLSLGVMGLERMCVPVLFKEISVDLNINLVQVGTIWGLDPLAGVIISLPAGLLADRFGIKRTITAGIFLAGLLGAGRGWSSNFQSLAITNFLFGLTASLIPSITPKITLLWFQRERLGLVNGLMQVSWSVGAVIATMSSATVFSPWLGGWQKVFFLFGVPAIIVGFLWLFTGRERTVVAPNATSKTIPLIHSISTVIRLKEIWVIGLMQFTLWGAFVGLSGYMSLYLKNLGWTVASADGVVTAMGLANLVGVIPMVYLADRFRARKKVLFYSLLGMIIAYILLPFVHGVWVYIVISLGAFVWAGGSPLYMTLIQETQGVGTTYTGTAVGMAGSIGMIGAVIAPPLGNSLASINLGAPFLFWAGLVIIGLPLFLLLKRRETAGAQPPRTSIVEN